MTTYAVTEQTSATSVAADDHDQIDAALARVSLALGGPTRELLAAYDTALGLLSRHLMGMEVAVCPVIARRLPAGRRLVGAHVAGARRLESVMRQMEQVLWDDARAPRIPLEVLQRQIAEEMAQHRIEEEHLLSALDSVLSEGERHSLGVKLEHATAHSPTRPHPYAVRRLSWTRALYRPVARVDRFMDVLSSRSVPAPRYVQRRNRRVGLWGAYALGQPLSAARKEEDEEA